MGDASKEAINEIELYIKEKIVGNFELALIILPNKLRKHYGKLK